MKRTGGAGLDFMEVSAKPGVTVQLALINLSPVLWGPTSTQQASRPKWAVSCVLQDTTVHRRLLLVRRVYAQLVISAQGMHPLLINS